MKVVGIEYSWLTLGFREMEQTNPTLATVRNVYNNLLVISITYNYNF
jgi:hypothetical protein